MSLLDETIQEFAVYGQEFDRMARKIDLMLEYTISDYEISRGEAELDFMTESVNGEDLVDIYVEAAEKAKEKLKKLLKAGDKNTKKYLMSTKESISKLEQKEYDRLLEEVKQKLRENPKYGKIKIEIVDYDNEIKSIEEGIAKSEKLLTKIKSKKKVTDADKQALKVIIDETNKKRDNSKNRKIIISTAVAMTMLTACLMIIKKNVDKHYVKDAKDEVMQSLDDLSPEDARFIVTLRNEINRLNKESSAVVMRKVVGIKNALQKFSKSYKPVSESVLDEIDWGDDLDSAVILQTVVESIKENNNGPFEEGTEMEDNMNYMVDELNELMDNFDESAVEDSTIDDEIDIDQLLEEAAKEAGLDDEDDIREESVEDDFDIDQLLEEAAEEAGLSDNSIDDLLDNFEESMNL